MRRSKPKPPLVPTPRQIREGAYDSYYDESASPSAGDLNPTIKKTETFPDRSAIYRPVTYQEGNRKLFQLGLDVFWQGDYERALVLFTAAAQVGPSDPLRRYFLAVTQRQMGQSVQARQTLLTAVELERQSPVANWGKRTERLQGPHRLWIEGSRRNSDIVR